MAALGRKRILWMQLALADEHQDVAVQPHEPHPAEPHAGVSVAVVRHDDLIGWQRHSEAIWEQDKRSRRTVADDREHRTQARNREAARARLSALLQLAAVRPKVRRSTKPGPAARERRLTSKKRRADVKNRRGRPDSES